MKNTKTVFLKLIFIFILQNTLFASGLSLDEQWKSSLAYEQYLQAKKSGDIKTATKIEIATIDAITKNILKSYVRDFKDKREAKMEAKTAKLPFQLRTLLADAYIQCKNLLKKDHKNEKDLNSFVYLLSSWIDSIYKGKGLALKRAHQLEKKFPELHSTPCMNLIISMSDSFDNIGESKRNIGESKRNIDESKRNIDESKRNIEKWDEMIKQLQSLPI